MKSIGEILLLRPSFIAAEGKRDFIPPIGSLLKNNSKPLRYLIVVDQFVESRIPGRTPAPYGLDYGDIESEQPQSTFLMRWMYQLVPVCELNGTKYEAPTGVPDIHTLLYWVEDAEFTEVLSSSSFMDFLFRIDETMLPQRNEVIMRLLRKFIVSVPQINRDKELLRILTRLSIIFRNDYSTLKQFIKSLEVKI